MIYQFSIIMTIRLLVFDVDGVLTQGETKALDLAFLGRLAEMNRLGRIDPATPQITLCTGRPAPYVEAMMQAIDGRLPAIFENGAGLYLPNSYQFLSHPHLGDGAAMQAVRFRLEETLVRSGQAFLQPGKEYSLSIFPKNPAERDRLYDITANAIGPLGQEVELTYSASCLNINPRGIDKGKGLQFLADETGYVFGDMLGVGDSDIDLPFLTLVGQSAAPANANEKVKNLVDFVAPRTENEGVQDILEHYGLVS
jgi:hypothetical protein